MLTPGAVIGRRPGAGRVSGIDHVADDLAAVFDDALTPETIRQVAVQARRELEREVPPEALPEFTHRLAWRRLVDLREESPAKRRARASTAGVGT